MIRDNFSPDTKSLLERAVGGYCVRPGCGKPTSARDPTTNKIGYIGVGAHDSAAAEGGPRFSPKLTSEQRSAYKNGAHLCADCARWVDDVPEPFPEGTLSRWQEVAEKNRRDQLQRPMHMSGTFDVQLAYENASKFLNACPSLQVSELESFIPIDFCNKMDILFQKCSLLLPNNELNALHPPWVDIQYEILRIGQLILNYIRKPEEICLSTNKIEKSHFWYWDDASKAYQLKCKLNPIPYFPICSGPACPDFNVSDREEYNKFIDISLRRILSFKEIYLYYKNTLHKKVNSPHY